MQTERKTMKIAALTVIALLITAGCSETATKTASKAKIEDQQRIEQAKKIRENTKKSRKNDYQNPRKFNRLTDAEKEKLESKLLLEKNSQMKSKNKGPEIIVQ